MMCKQAVSAASQYFGGKRPYAQRSTVQDFASASADFPSIDDEADVLGRSSHPAASAVGRVHWEREDKGKVQQKDEEKEGKFRS